uniref:Uncharacterized protein n=1 Tax=Anguilla anguilla TaxID=7936 RepID=A0A0E9QT21_ANGAN
MYCTFRTTNRLSIASCFCVI